MSEKKKTGKAQAPTKAQWAALYEVAENLKKLAPWRFLWGEDIITLVLPDFAEPFFCSVMDLGEEGGRHRRIPRRRRHHAISPHGECAAR